MVSDSTDQPGNSEQLARIVEAAERYYESSRKAIVIYWDLKADRYRIGYQSIYKPDEFSIQVVKFP